MVTVYDIQAGDFLSQAADELRQTIKKPDWAGVVKTGCHKERPPHDEDWWYMRSAAVLRTVCIRGPIGVQKLRHKYGGRRRRGTRPDEFRKGSGAIIRRILQQLQEAGLVEISKHATRKGRVITKKGQSFLDNIAYKVSKTAPAVQEVKEPKVKEGKEPKEKEAKHIQKDKEVVKEESKKVSEKKEAPKKNE